MDRGRVEKSVDVMIVKLRQLKWEKGSTTETLCCYYTQFSDKKNYLKWKMVKVRKNNFFFEMPKSQSLDSTLKENERGLPKGAMEVGELDQRQSRKRRGQVEEESETSLRHNIHLPFSYSFHFNAALAPDSTDIQPIF